jgi:hypothetical protein
MEALYKLNVKNVMFSLLFLLFAHTYTYGEDYLEKSVSKEASKGASIEQQVQSSLSSKNYVELGKILRKSYGKRISYSQLHSIAKKQHAEPLLQALGGLKALNPRANKLNISAGEFLQHALYIETNRAAQTAKKRTYLTKNQTGLSQPIEFDQETGHSFIHLKDFIGEGAEKVVTKSILYKGSQSKIVARAQRSDKKETEFEITKKMQNAPGIMETYAFTRHKEGRKNYKAIFSKLYSPGSLQTAFEKGIKFSKAEKIAIALSLLKGLEQLHGQNYVHRDLGARNYLIDISGKKQNKRKISAVIADLGRALHYSETAQTKVQGNTSYTAPEGIFLKQMKPKDYFAADVYALGCVLYWLCYDKQAPWQDSMYVKNTDITKHDRYKMLVESIEQTISGRRAELRRKKASGHSPYERFEATVLRMVDPNPKKRGSAAELRKEIDTIVKKGLPLDFYTGGQTS